MCEVRRTQHEVWVQTRDYNRPSLSTGKGTQDVWKDAESLSNMAEVRFRSQGGGYSAHSHSLQPSLPTAMLSAPK